MSLLRHLPFGVVYDQLRFNSKIISPLEITVHFSNYPSTELIPCEGVDTVRLSYFNSLKQALFLAYGSTKAIMSLPKMEQIHLFQAVADSKLQLYNIDDTHSLSPPTFKLIILE